MDNIRDSISEVLSSDDDMAAMYLTSKLEYPRVNRLSSDHEEIEIIMEYYLKSVHEISSSLEEMEENVQSTEEIVSIGLEGQRNDLILLELKLTMGTLAAAIGAFGASIFGMNLKSNAETMPFVFYLVTTGLLSIALLIYRRCLKNLKHVVGGKL